MTKHEDDFDDYLESVEDLVAEAAAAVAIDSPFDPADEALPQSLFIVLNSKDEIAQTSKNLRIREPSHDGLQDYLRQIGRIQSLTSEDEILLAKRIEAGLIAEDILKQKPEIPLEDRRNLMWVKKDGARAESALIEANLRLVVTLARSFAGQGLAFLDLIQEGNMGLIRAVEKFDYKMGFKFSNYATWWIRQSISRALADKGRTIRIPVHVTDFLKKIRRTEKLMLESTGFQPTIEDLAAELEVSPKKILQTLEFGKDALSLYDLVHDGDEFNELAENLEDVQHPNPEDSVGFALAEKELEKILHELHPREAGVIRARFGLGTGVQKTLEEIGEEFGVTRERIRQIEAKTMSKLRHPSRSEMLKDYLEN